MQSIELLFMDYCSRVKSNELYNKLLSLDLDEGIKIESLTQDKKIFVNKNASGIFVIQIVNKDEGKDDNINIRYMRHGHNSILHFSSII